MILILLLRPMAQLFSLNQLFVQGMGSGMIRRIGAEGESLMLTMLLLFLGMKPRLKLIASAL